jgi:hypothetical protein
MSHTAAPDAGPTALFSTRACRLPDTGDRGPGRHDACTTIHSKKGLT